MNMNPRVKQLWIDALVPSTGIYKVKSMRPLTNVQVQLTGEDGNALAIIGRASEAMRLAGISNLIINNYMDEVMASDYANVIHITMKYVEVT